MNERQKMIEAIEQYTVPEIRKHGFSGEFPFFYRKKADRYDQLIFRLSAVHYSFTVECSYAFEGSEKNWPKQSLHRD